MYRYVEQDSAEVIRGIQGQLVDEFGDKLKIAQQRPHVSILGYLELQNRLKIKHVHDASRIKEDTYQQLHRKLPTPETTTEKISHVALESATVMLMFDTEDSTAMQERCRAFSIVNSKLHRKGFIPIHVTLASLESGQIMKMRKIRSVAETLVNEYLLSDSHEINLGSLTNKIKTMQAPKADCISGVQQQ